MSRQTYLVVKRGIDIVLALALMLLFFPIWIIIPLLIKIDSNGPVIYRHLRIGKNGREFWMYKFRSMVDGAHEMLHNGDTELLKKFKKQDWKLENDPRITRLGKLLRTFTIDEFPQLINVLRGEMSIVGPRAYMSQELEEQIERYPEVKDLITDIMSIKPGITGPWQVAGRNEIPFVRRASLDATYARNISLWDDIKIIIKTPQAMLSKW